MDDFFIVPAGTAHLDVVVNDQIPDDAKLSLLTQPASGSALVQGRRIVLEIPVGTSEKMTFDYRITSNGQTSDATVVVSPQQSLAPNVSTQAEFFGNRDGTPLDAAGSETTETNPLSIKRVLDTLRQPPPVWLSLLDLEAPLLPTLGVIGLSLLMLALVTRRARRRTFAAIRTVRRGHALTTDSGTDSSFRFRHDAQRVWRTGRQRRRLGLVQVETPTGTAWVHQSELDVLGH